MVNSLAITAAGAASVTHATTDVTNVAISAPGFSVDFNDANGLTVTSVDGVDGISANDLDVNVSGNLTIANTSATNDITTTQSLNLNVTANDAVLTTAVGAHLRVTSSSDLKLVADEMDLAATMSASQVRLENFNAGELIILGTNPGQAGTLELSDAELDLVGGTVRVGRNDASASGNITVTAPISLGTLIVRTGAGIVDGNASGTDITATNLTLRTVNGVGNSGADQVLEINATSLAFFNGSGGSILLNEANGLSLANINGFNPSSSSDVNISSTTGNITVTNSTSVTGTASLTLNAIANNVTVSNAVTSASGNITLQAGADVVSSGASGSVATTSGNLFFTGDNDLSGSGTITFDRPINLGSGTATFSLSSTNGTVSDVISGAGNFVKSGSGTLTLTDPNTYSGTTAVNAGRLNLTGSITSNTTVANGGTLGGTGTINSANTLTVQSGGHVAPGTSPGILNSGSVSFASGSFFDVEIGGTTPGSANNNHDQLVVTGTVSLGGATLTTTAFNSFVPVGGNTFAFLLNDGSEAFTGTFNGLAQGATISNFLGSGLSATISYVGNADSGTTGNDVVLTVLVPSLDLGDAPSPYPTTLAENGARHIATGPTLGTNRDAETDGTHSANANFDDTTGSPDDEEGVTFGTIRVGALAATVTVNVAGITTTGKLDAWIDFNGDGVWGGPMEQIANDVTVVNGNNTLTFDVPSWAKDGATFARFRLSTAGNLSPEGSAADGEVEDHTLTILAPVATPGIFGGQQVVTNLADQAEGVFAADVDSDGDMDVLSASRQDDKIAWYENNGTESFTAHTITTSANFAQTVFAVDLDQDGDVDVLSTSAQDDRVAWYENNGSEVFTAHDINNPASGNPDTPQSLFVADMDGDGDLDVMTVSNNDGKVAWFENNGSQSFTQHDIATGDTGGIGVFAADIDTDGDMDLVTASFFQDKITWYENNGSETFTEHVVSTTADGARQVFAADLDGDGDMDLLSASRDDDQIAWYENNGSELFTERNVNTPDPDAPFTGANGDLNGPTDLFVADMDGDGDQDVVATATFTSEVVWYQNNGSQSFTRQSISTVSGGFDAVFVADVDTDGDLDVLTASINNDTIAWFENRLPTLTATLSGGDLTITDVDGTKNNTLTVVVSGSNLVITDTNEAFDVAPSGGTLSNGNKTLTIPAASVTGTLTINSAGGTDTINVSALSSTLLSSLRITGGNGTDTVNLNGDATFAPGKDLLVEAETVNVAAGVDLLTQNGGGEGSLFFTADDVSIALTSTLVSAHVVGFTPQTAGRSVNLGTIIGGSLSLTDADLDRITSNSTQISNDSGTITVSAPITHGNVLTLSVGNNQTIDLGTFSLASTVGVSLITSGTGSITTADNSGTDIAGLAVAIISGSGGIGSTTNFVRIAANEFSAVTSGNGEIHVAEADVVEIQFGGPGILDAGTATITLGGGKFLTSSDDSILSPITLASGATLGGTGTTQAVTAQSGGHVAPGTSPGILNSGNVSFSSGSFFDVEIGGTTPGSANSNYDQLVVTGTVNLGGATLTTTAFNSFVPTAGNTFAILLNDGSDAITGTFNGLAEGAAITNFLGTGLIATISYVGTADGGATGNDVVLTVGIAPTLSAALSSNNLTIADNDGTKNNSLTVSVSGANLVITDANEAFISAPAGGTLSNNNKTLTIPASSVTSTLTINGAGGADTINISALGSTLVAGLTINGGTGADIINVNGDVTFANNKSLDLDLQNDDATPGVDQIFVAADANLILSGTGAATLKASRNIALAFGSSIITVNGGITLSANQQAVASSGKFHGIGLDAATIQTQGTGYVLLDGRSGDSGRNQAGIHLDNGARVDSTSTSPDAGTVTLIGMGGATSATTSGFGYDTIGVYIRSTTSIVASNGADISVTGTGGGTNGSSDNYGAIVSGTISAGGNGDVTVIGHGGNLTGTGNSNAGIDVTSEITSVDGNITLTGTGGGGNTSEANIGVYLNQAIIAASGAGQVLITGNGGNSGLGASGGFNPGVFFGGEITTNGGDIVVTGTGGSGEVGVISGTVAGLYRVNSAGVGVIGTITAGTGGTVTVTGTGGTSVNGALNAGVAVVDGAITSTDSTVTVTGVGGSGSGGMNYGVGVLDRGFFLHFRRTLIASLLAIGV